MTKPLPINLYIVDFPGLDPRNEITGAEIIPYFSKSSMTSFFPYSFSHGLVI